MAQTLHGDTVKHMWAARVFFLWGQAINICVLSFSDFKWEYGNKSEEIAAQLRPN